KNNPNGNIYITTLDNSHNHNLSPYRTKFFNDSELTQEIYDRDMLNDAASLYEELVRRKNEDPRCLLDLAKALEASIEEEIKKAKYAYWKTQILLTSFAATLPQTLFPKLDKALSRFIIPEIQKIQHAEIKSCLNYHASAITKDEMIKYQEVVQFHRQDVLEKLQNLLTEIQDKELVNSPANDDNEEMYSNSLDDNEEYEETNSLSDIPLQKPKKHKAKGRPKSSKQIKQSEELKPAKRQNQCGNCG
ncbi:28775_t:CDS:2, partial [Racocetra persica]